MNFANIARCSVYPCTVNNLYGLEAASLTFATAADKDARLEAIKPLAVAEANLDEHLMQVCVCTALWCWLSTGQTSWPWRPPDHHHHSHSPGPWLHARHTTPDTRHLCGCCSPAAAPDRSSCVSRPPRTTCWTF
jgi:hypothetical protein